MRTDYAYTTMMKFEHEVNSFLSSSWPAFQTGKAVLISDKKLQYAGVDISCINGLKIDTKIKNTKSINEVFEYPSVEITIKHGQLSGWFISPKTITDAYLFVSVFSSKTRYQDITADDIDSLDCLMFSKEELKKHIEHHATLDSVYHDALELDECNDRKNYYDSNGKKVFHLKYSPYNEGAVNLVLHRSILKGLPSSRMFTLKRKRA